MISSVSRAAQRALELGPVAVAGWAARGLALAHVGFAYGLQPGVGWGPSMLPTLAIWEPAGWVSAAARRGRGLRVGDIVVYAIPVEPASEGMKRVLGLPGDWVCLDDPGSAASASSFSDAAGAGAARMIRVPQGHCWLVGDNLPWSRDSRDFGPLPLALVKGKLIARGPTFSNGWQPWRWFTRIENGLHPVSDPSQLDAER